MAIRLGVIPSFTTTVNFMICLCFLMVGGNLPNLQGIHNLHGMETATQTGIYRGIQTQHIQHLTQPNPPYMSNANTPSNPSAPSNRTQVMVRMVLTLTSSSRVVIVCRVKPPHFTRRLVGTQGSVNSDHLWY